MKKASWIIITAASILIISGFVATYVSTILPKEYQPILSFSYFILFVVIIITIGIQLDNDVS